MIPAEAVEAAAKAMYAQDGGAGEFNLEVYEDYAKAMLEAAAPYMLSEVFDEGEAYGFDLARGVVEPTPNPYSKDSKAVPDS